MGRRQRSGLSAEEVIKYHKEHPEGSLKWFVDKCKLAKNQASSERTLKDNIAKQKHNIEELKNNPIFQLSLSSKELFHSNFLYWLSEYNRTLFKELLDELTNQEISWTDNWIVLREDNNYDLSVRSVTFKGDNNKQYVQDYLFILENKVKSIVTNHQLKDYYKEAVEINKKFNSRGCVCCLLSLASNFLEKDIIEKEKLWVLKSYHDLSVSLKKIYLGEELIDNNTYIIDQYVKYVEILSDNNFLQLPSADAIWKETAIDISLKNLRLDDLRQKLIANVLASLIYTMIKDKKVEVNIPDRKIWDAPNNDTIYLSAGFTNGRLLVILSKFVNSTTLVRFEVEGDKYKRSVIIKKESSGKYLPNFDWKSPLPQMIKNLFVEQILDSNAPLIAYPEAVNGGWALKKKNVGTYDMANLMKYQSKIIPAGSRIDQVAKAMVADLNKIF